ncbi:MAG: outer membrane beta-barrel protein [Saprospiraceae bacterium]|nr:outer membrane beta-barrel protein [Saprospiraceae bacterium]
MCKILLTFVFCSLLLCPESQAQDEIKDPTFNFGLQAGVIFPSSLFRVRNRVEESNGISYRIEPSIGTQFGGIATFRLSEKFQLQGGFSLLLRRYECTASTESEQRSLKINTTIYEVPLLLMYYQRLGSQLLLTAGTGVNLQTLPSDLTSKTDGLDIIAFRRAFALPSSLTMLGLEFRKKGAGGFFAGLSYCITPFHLYDTGFRTRFNGQSRFYAIPHIGDYFCVVGRYYLD